MIDWLEARRLYEDDGKSLREIGAVFHCSPETVRKRRMEQGWTRSDAAVALRDRERVARTEDASAATRLKWEEARAAEADGAGRDSAVLREVVMHAANDGDWNMVRATAIAYAIFVDKAQLLTGGATSRPALPDEIAGHVNRLGGLRDELSDRRTLAS